MSGQWMDVHEAAESLGISAEAVRKRVQRGSMEGKRDRDKLYVWLDDGPTQSRQAPSAPDIIEVLRTQVDDLREQLRAEREANRENRRLLAAALERIPEIESSEQTQEADPQAPGGDADPEYREPASSGKSRSWWRWIVGG